MLVGCNLVVGVVNDNICGVARLGAETLPVAGKPRPQLWRGCCEIGCWIRTCGGCCTTGANTVKTCHTMVMGMVSTQVPKSSTVPVPAWHMAQKPQVNLYPCRTLHVSRPWPFIYILWIPPSSLSDVLSIRGCLYSRYTFSRWALDSATMILHKITCFAVDSSDSDSVHTAPCSPNSPNMSPLLLHP